MKKNILAMKDVKVYRKNKKNVLNIEDFSMKAGEIVAVVGPNGAGKSTFFQVVNLLLPFEGKMKLFGENVDNTNKIELRRRCSYVFQEMLLLKDTVFNNIAKSLYFRGLSKSEAAIKVNSILKEFSCEHLADRSAYSLSGGEAQRVCIARAMVSDPELLILDEPSASLDAQMKSEMISSIKNIAEEKGISVILVSHNFSDVLHFAERAVVMFEGNLVQDCTPEFLMRRPADERTAKLVNMDNIIPCKIDVHKKIVKLQDDLEFLYPYSIKESYSKCCIPGDCVKIRSMDFFTQNTSEVVLEGIVENILPDIGTSYVIVRCKDQAIVVRVPKYHIVSDNIKKNKLVKITFSSLDTHLI